LRAWGFTYKANLVWHKIRKDGSSDGRGVGFYFRNVTELILFGVRGKNARTLAPGRRQVNLLATRKREHSRKSNTTLSRRAAPALFLSCLREESEADGPHGAIRRMRIIDPCGRPMLFRVSKYFKYLHDHRPRLPY
jgi:MT-A70